MRLDFLKHCDLLERLMVSGNNCLHMTSIQISGMRICIYNQKVHGVVVSTKIEVFIIFCSSNNAIESRVSDFINADVGGEECQAKKPTTERKLVEIVDALHLGERSRASQLLSEFGNRDLALKLQYFVPIFEYCSRTPDPLVGVLFVWCSVARPTPVLFEFRIFWNVLNENISFNLNGFLK